MCSAVEEYAKEYAAECERKAKEETKVGVVESLIKRGFPLSEALEIADIDEETYNKYKIA